MTVEAELAGERIDVLLARLLPDLTRSGAQKLLEDGRVTKDGQAVRKNYKTAP